MPARVAAKALDDSDLFLFTEFAQNNNLDQLISHVAFTNQAFPTSILWRFFECCESSQVYLDGKRGNTHGFPPSTNR